MQSKSKEIMEIALDYMLTHTSDGILRKGVNGYWDPVYDFVRKELYKGQKLSSKEEENMRALVRSSINKKAKNLGLIKKIGKTKEQGGWILDKELCKQYKNGSSTSPRRTQKPEIKKEKIIIDTKQDNRFIFASVIATNLIMLLYVAASILNGS